MKYSQTFQHENFFSRFLRQKPSEALQSIMDEIFQEQLKGQQGALEAITANFSTWAAMNPKVRFDDPVINGMGRAAYTNYIASNAGVHLMRLDSDIAEIIGSECAVNGVGFHLLHDGFYCEPEFAADMVELMQYAFYKVLGVPLPAHLIKVVMP
jgi:hypothetical protein